MKHRLLALSGSIGLSLCWANPVFSQSATGDSTESTRTIGEIIVTAQKREQRLEDVGLTITAVSGEELSERRISSVQDIVDIVPGLSYSESGTATPIYTLRGVGFNEESLGVYPSVSIYTDEVPLPFPVLTLHSAYDLERVEILKGPQGTLFGQNATGGAINYVAAKPTKDFQYGVEASIGRFDHRDVNAFISGPLSDDVSARLAISMLDRDGWQRSITRSGDKTGEQNYVAGRFTLDWEASESLFLRFGVNAWQDKADPQAGQLIAVRSQLPEFIQQEVANSPFPRENARDADWTPGALAPSSDRKFFQGSIRAELDLGAVTLTSLTSLLDFTQELSADKDGMVAEIANLTPSDADIESFNQEIRISNNDVDGLRWVVGANYEKSETDEDQAMLFGGGSSSNPTTLFINNTVQQNKQDIEIYAFFVNGEYDLTNRVTVKVGGRFTESKIDANLAGVCGGDGNTCDFFNILGETIGAVPFDPVSTRQPYVLNFQGVPGERFKDTLREDNFSWRVGIDYKPSDDTLLYGNISRGYKTGSYPTLSASSFEQYIPVTQESVTAYEAGVKASFAERAVILNAAAFYYDYEDKQVRGKLVDPVFDVLDTLLNVPESEIWGVEADITVRPSRNLRLGASVTYLNSEVKGNFVTPTAYGNSCTSDGNPAQCNVSGTDLPFTPEISYAANIDYRIPMKSGDEIFMGMSLRGQDKSYSTLYGEHIEFRTLPEDGHNQSIRQPFKIPSYITTDARIGYEFAGGRASVMLWGKNIFDEYYVTNANHFLDASVRFTGQPRTFGITVSYRN